MNINIVSWRCCWLSLQTLLLILVLDRSQKQVYGFSSVSISQKYGHGRGLITPSSPPSSHSRVQVRPQSLKSVTSITASTAVDDSAVDDSPTVGKDGIVQLEDRTQHMDFLEENEDNLVVMKIFAPWCRACKGLAPKFQQIATDEQYQDLPIKFCELTIQHNKEYVKSLGVLALPSVQFYMRGQIMDTFPCGPSKVPILKKKLARFVLDYVDDETKQVKEASEIPVASEDDVSADAGSAIAPKKEAVQQELTKEQIEQIRSIPFFKSLSEEDFEVVLQKGKVLTFKEGSVIMREGNRGSTFYAILDGEVEVCQQTAFLDPLTTPASYLGTVINRLESGDFFGERALITGEPRAASIRTAQLTHCVSWNGIDLPQSCDLNRRGKAAFTDDMSTYNDKYGVALDSWNDFVGQQVTESNMANQVRGSALTPGVIKGVDTDDEIEIDLDALEAEAAAVSQEEITTSSLSPQLMVENDAIISLLQRFKLVRLVSRTFEYVMTFGTEWGEPSLRRRRSMLVHRLTVSQREEFRDAFKLVDSNGDGEISLSELQRVMVTAGDEKSAEDLNKLLNTNESAQFGDNVDRNRAINFEDFMGMMAEAEFYYLFRDIFASLDTYNSGFVRAKDLDRVLSGVRDLISDDRKSIIDVPDQDMLIDYEQFSKMLLGTKLVK